MSKKKFIVSLCMAVLPFLGYSQTEPTIDLKSEESLLILIDAHSKIKNINEIHVHLNRLLAIMDVDKDRMERIVRKCGVLKDRASGLSTAYEHIMEYCLGIKTNGSIRVYSALRRLPQDDPDAILIEHFRQAVIKSAELFNLTPAEYVISGKF